MSPYTALCGKRRRRSCCFVNWLWRPARPPPSSRPPLGAKFQLRYGSPTPRALFVEDRGYGYGDPLQCARTTCDWMRRGSQEGWLNGWRAERAWGEFRAIRDESFAGGYGRHDAWRRLDRLSDFVRWAHDNAGY